MQTVADKLKEHPCPNTSTLMRQESHVFFFGFNLVKNVLKTITQYEDKNIISCR